MKRKTRTLAILAVLLLFSGYLFYESLSYHHPHSQKQEIKHNKLLPRIPKDLSYCGEDVHFKSPESYQKFYQEYYYHSQQRFSAVAVLRNASAWLSTIEEILKQHKVPSDLKYIALAESNLENSRVSPMGAAGIWQFTPETARTFGLRITEEVDERLDPIKSTHAACRYLKMLHTHLGNWTSATAAYNCGEGALFLAFKRQQVYSYYDLDLNRETSGYLYRIVALKGLVEHPERFNLKYMPQPPRQYKALSIDYGINDVESWAKQKSIDIAQLKLLNPWILGRSLTPDSATPFTLYLP